MASSPFAVLLGEADGKLSLDNSPRKFLPYFTLQDKNAQDKITLRDLMCHNSGLPRTDLLWYTNALTRQEVISALAYVTRKTGREISVSKRVLRRRRGSGCPCRKYLV